MPTGYRRGDIGTYSGERPEKAGVAWKALDFEYRELGNEHTRTDVAKFLGLKPASWDKVLAEFRERYGDAKGIWLTRTGEASKLYKEFGPVEKVHFDEKDVIVDLGYDGIYVLDRRDAKEARHGLQLSEPEYREGIASGRYPDPEKYERLTAYYPEPHGADWKGKSLAELYPGRYEGVSSDRMSDTDETALAGAIRAVAAGRKRLLSDNRGVRKLREEPKSGLRGVR